ncbi:MAG TPA: pitrilysin family protein [bacterium]
MTDEYELTTLANGARVLARRMPQALSASLGFWVRAGGRHETPALSGVSHFLEHLVFKGTRRWGCEELKRQVEGVGGSLNGFTDEEYTCYLAKVPARYARRALSALGEMVCRPRLAPKDVERERDVILEEIRMYEDAPGQYVHDLMHALLWPNHPLGMLLSGTIDSVRRIKHRDLVAYWRLMYQPRNLLVTAVGQVEPRAVAAQARRLMGRLSGRPVRPVVRAPRPKRRPQARIWKKPTEQTHLCLGLYAVPRTHPDRFALEILHVILGANMSSRLFREVREKRGLVYEIGSQVKRYADTGAFMISAGCDTGKLPQTLSTIASELARMRISSVPRAELARAKEYYAGQLIMGLEDTTDHMLWAGEQVVTVGRPARAQALLAHIDRVSATDVRRVARRLFRSDRAHLAVVGPLAETEAPRLLGRCRIG